VEDTLNNSNDLFLTFRKEMEEMSKKTKRLEKENLQLTRKQDATNRNVLQMAEERTKQDKEMSLLQKRNAKLEQLCRTMQDQSRGGPGRAGGRVNPGTGNVPAFNGREDVMGFEGDGDEAATDSEYDDEYDEDEVGSEEYDDETEEETLDVVSAPTTYGPVPPPPPPPTTAASGKVQVNGQINGQRGNGKQAGW
jgi:hypothetical protein